MGFDSIITGFWGVRTDFALNLREIDVLPYEISQAKAYIVLLRFMQVSEQKAF